MVEKEKPRLFLSHNHADKDFVRKLAIDLERNGAYIWLDEAEINVGDSLIQKISEGIMNVDFLGVVLSKNSVNSIWVRKEVEIALIEEINGKRIKVLPILLEKCEVPLFLKDKFYADFTQMGNYTNSLSLLLRALDIDAKSIIETKFTFESLKNYLLKRLPNREITDWNDIAELLRELNYIDVNTSEQLNDLLIKAAPAVTIYENNFINKMLKMTASGFVRTSMWVVNIKASETCIAGKQMYKKYNKFVINV